MAEDIKASQGQTPSEWRWASALDREIGGPTHPLHSEPSVRTGPMIVARTNPTNICFRFRRQAAGRPSPACAGEGVGEADG